MIAELISSNFIELTMLMSEQHLQIPTIYHPYSKEWISKLWSSCLFSSDTQLSLVMTPRPNSIAKEPWSFLGISGRGLVPTWQGTVMPSLLRPKEKHVRKLYPDEAVWNRYTDHEKGSLHARSQWKCLEKKDLRMLLLGTLIWRDSEEVESLAWRGILCASLVLET